MKTLVLRVIFFIAIFQTFSCQQTGHQEIGGEVGGLHISKAWIRPIHPGSEVTAAYLQIENRGADDALISAGAPWANEVQIHEMRLTNEVMRMRQIDSLPCPGSQTVALKPEGNHLMILGIKEDAGSLTNLPLTLRFRSGAELTLHFPTEKGAQNRACCE